MTSQATAIKPRWVRRFESYDRAFLRLRMILEEMEEREFNEYEKESVIARFQYAWDQAWRLINDLLSDEGMEVPVTTPQSVIRAGLQAGIITDGDVWMDALEARKQLSHAFSPDNFERALTEIRSDYSRVLGELHLHTIEKIIREGEA